MTAPLLAVALFGVVLGAVLCWLAWEYRAIKRDLRAIDPSRLRTWTQLSEYHSLCRKYGVEARAELAVHRGEAHP